MTDASPQRTLAFPSTTAYPAHSRITDTHTHAFPNAHLNFLARIIIPKHSSFPAHPETPDIHTGFGSGASVAARCCSCTAAYPRRCGCRCCRLSSPDLCACWRCPVTPPRARRRTLTTCRRPRIPLTGRVPEEPGLARPPTPRDRNPTNQ